MAEVSASDHMNNLLATKPLVQRHGTRTTTIIVNIDTPFGTIPDQRQVETPYTYQTPAKAINSKVVEVQNLTFDNARVTELPQTGLLTRKTLQNCADVTATSSIGLTVTGTQTWGVTKTNSVSTTVGASVNASVGVPMVAGGGMTLTFSQQISTSTAVAEGGSQQISRTSNETISIGPKRAVSIELFAYQAAAEIPFSGLIIIDGDLEENDSGVTQASALLSLSERTLPFDGILRLSDVSQANLRTSDLGGTQGCEGNQTPAVIEERFPPIPAGALGSYLLDRFQPLASLKRSTTSELLDHLGKFSTYAWNADDEEPTIGAPDGISYEVLYTTQVYEPSPACGFNDLGLMNVGIFSVESRQYRNYSNGLLINQWQDNVKTFVGCHDI